MDLTCFNPQTASGGFTLLFGVAMLIVGALGTRWLIRNKPAEVKKAEDAARDFDDKRRGQ